MRTPKPERELRNTETASNHVIGAFVAAVVIIVLGFAAFKFLPL